MGGSESTISEKLYDEQEYELVQSLTDPRYGPIKILRHKTTGFLVCESTKTINNQDVFDTKVQHSAGRKQLQHPALVQFLNYTADVQEEFCSKFWKISRLYEYVNQDLKEQVNVRTTSNIRYREGELWYLLQAAVNGLTYLKGKDIIHGDIRPQNILFTSNGQLKLGEQFQEDKPLTAYQQILMDIRKSEFYLAPQVFESLKDKHVAAQFDVGANDVFALGLTILEAATLQNVDSCYNVEENYIFNCERLRDLLLELSSLYSSKFHSIISRMLIESDCDRPTLEDLKNELEVLFNDELFLRDIGENVVLYQLQEEPVENTEVVEQVEHCHHEGEEEVEEQQYVENQVEEEQVKRAHHTNVDVQQHGQYDLGDIDQRISRVLAMSRDTVKKYGGEKAYHAYEQYEISKGYEPVHSSQIGSPTYASNIYTVKPSYTTTSYVVKSSEEEQVKRTSHHKHEEHQPVTTSTVYRSEQQYQPTQTHTTTTYSYKQPETVTYSHQPQSEVRSSQYVRREYAEEKPLRSSYVRREVVQAPAEYKTEKVNEISYNSKEIRSSGIVAQPSHSHTTTTYQTYQPTTYQPTTYSTTSYQQHHHHGDLAGSRRVVNGSTTTTYQQQPTTTYTTSSVAHHHHAAENKNLTQEELDQQIKTSLQRSKDIENMIQSTKKAIGTEEVCQQE